MTRYSDAIHDSKPSATSCSNWMYTVRQPSEITAPVDYLSGDVNYIWSAFRAMLEAKYMDSRGKKWELMAWGFTSVCPWPSDHFIFKTVPALCQEAAMVLANGGSIIIYDMPNPWGPVVDWHMDDLAEVARFCRARQADCQDAVLVPQAAIYHNPDHYYKVNSPLYNFGDSVNPLEGALHAVHQNGYAVNLLSKGDLLRRVREFPLWVLPEQSVVTEDVRQALLAYVEEGGSLLLSGDSCRFFQQELGVEITDEVPVSRGEVDSPLQINQAKYLSVEVGNRTQHLGPQFMGVRNVSADTEFPLLASRDAGPHRILTGYAAATVKSYGKGRISGIYGPFFEEYFRSHDKMLRQFLDSVIEQLQPVGLAKVTASPNVSFSLRKKNGLLQAHLVNLSCDPITTPESPCVEEVPAIGPVELAIPMDAEPKALWLQPGGNPVDWRYADGLLRVHLPQIGIYDIVVIQP